MRRLRVMPDYRCWPVWEDEEVGNVDPGTLPISTALRRRLLDWAAAFDATLNDDDPSGSGFATEEQKLDHETEGRRLAMALQRELGPDFSVRWWRDKR
jgi:hypothetical protein